MSGSYAVRRYSSTGSVTRVAMPTSLLLRVESPLTGSTEGCLTVLGDYRRSVPAREPSKACAVCAPTQCAAAHRLTRLRFISRLIPACGRFCDPGAIQLSFHVSAGIGPLCALTLISPVILFRQ